MNKLYHDGDYQTPRGILEDKRENWTELQAVLRWSLQDVTPNRISLSGAADPESTAMTITANVKQSWAIGPPRPFTLYSGFSILVGEARNNIVLTSKSRDHRLLGDPLGYSHYLHLVQPDADDWKTVLPFVTIPPGEDGLTVRREIKWKDLLGGHDVGRSEGNSDWRPEPGEEYNMTWSRGRYRLHTTWWNWGDLEGNLKDKRLVNMVDPRLNGVQNPGPPPPDVVLPYDSWKDRRDGDRNTYVWLQMHLDTKPLTVQFVE